jgi:hypothetical protein
VTSLLGSSRDRPLSEICPLDWRLRSFINLERRKECLGASPARPGGSGMRRHFVIPIVLLISVASAASAGTLVASAPVPASSTASSPLAGCTLDSGQISPTSLVYMNSEVEPWVATDPTNPLHLVGAWQQDRWSNGGARGLVTATSFDGGTTWSAPNASTWSSLCTGGTVANRGDFQRATDPWTTVAPNGDTYLMSLSLNNPDTSADHAMLVMKSTNGGVSWGDPTTLIRENNPAVLNDKNSMTADPNEADGSHVYAVWDRLELPNERVRGQAVENAFPFTGPILFTRTTNAGASWETPREIFRPKGRITQTIGNQIVVLPDLNNTVHEGQVVNGFTLISIKQGGNVFGAFSVALIRSADQGTTWDQRAIIVDKLFNRTVRDPLTGDPARTQDIIPDFAVDANNGSLYAVWQDSRFNGFAFNGIAFSMSVNGGLTWSTPIEVNRTPAAIPAGNQQAFTPSVHVLPNGTVGVSYYDFRNNGTTDTSVNDPLETDHFMVHCHSDCTNASALTTNWTETRITQTSFNLRRAPVARGYFVGDYVGLSNTGTGGNSFLAFFGQSLSTTDPATVYSSRIAP